MKPSTPLTLRRRLALEIAEAIFDLYGLSQAHYDLDGAVEVIDQHLPLTYAEAQQAIDELCKGETGLDA